MDAEKMPLFPLRTVLFPDGPLPLRIFEPRYLDMVGRCLREDGEFGVLLLVGGSEIGAARTELLGTLARIADWYQGNDGLLGVTALGTTRFRLESTELQRDGLYVGMISRLPPEPAVALPDKFRPLAELLAVILEDLGKLYGDLPRRFDDAGWVANRFAEVLPMPLESKQRCLQMDDPIERLEFLSPMVRSSGGETIQ